MGNTVDCGSKLKVEDYPNDIKEDEWEPSGFEETTTEDQEILIIKGKDRRVRAQPVHYRKDANSKLMCVCGHWFEKKTTGNVKKVVCICGSYLQETLGKNCYGGKLSVRCDNCRECVSDNDIVYHCAEEQHKMHTHGYDLCVNCSKSGRICCTLCHVPLETNSSMYICTSGKNELHPDGLIFCNQCAVYEINKTNHNVKTINNIIQLRMEFSKTRHKIGSGTIIHHTLNRAFVLTAAHNVVELNSHDKKLHFVENIWVHTNRNTTNGFDLLKRYKCIDYRVHPEYIKFLKTLGMYRDNPESQTGYDIAVIEVLDTNNELKDMGKIRLSSHNSKDIDRMRVKVIGFPGEKKLRGQLYGMMGNAEVNYVNEEIKYNKLLVYDNIDTSKGQSGCPVFKVEENKQIDEKCDDQNDDGIFKEFYEIVGVHVAKKSDPRLNYATYLNKTLIQWINDYICVEQMQYMTYDAGVLLITSSKAKYASMLNEIYKKCVKTEIMSTIRLYYDYVTEERVEKKEVLSYIIQLFQEKRQKYLIFYCGESDENGNWVINNNKSDNITLQDLLLCTKRIRGRYGRYSVRICSDCNQSGNWVRLKQSNPKKFQGIMIQASSKEKETCNAGTFTSKYAKCCFGYSASGGNYGKVVGFIGALGVSGLGVATVGTLYDGVFKQPYHKASKKSQPISTVEMKSWQFGGEAVGNSRDNKYAVGQLFYNSWYKMDVTMTAFETGPILYGLY